MSKKKESIDRTSGGLRSALFDEIDNLRNGKSSLSQARALAMLANTALKSVELEIDYNKYVSDVVAQGGVGAIGLLEMGQTLNASKG